MIRFSPSFNYCSSEPMSHLLAPLTPASNLQLLQT